MPSSTKTRRKREALWGAVFFALIQLVTAAVLVWGASLVPEQMKWLQWILWALAALSVLPLPFVGVALRQRWLEIEGGESDAAAQY